MNYEQKKNEIEESYINGQREQCRQQFRKLSKADRKEILNEVYGIAEDEAENFIYIKL